ncbi:hypothetical protein [Caldimonas brevitalea]|uniref:Uncharacterized protein n=1 Tax=Caldimonas brevitalea TaxID=413882 RepID=A0A0G3BLV7_9BURK|nr:hypothetical protein [Caldimonas brevitalea]AKJ27545.1 hypothetical protein AAW51_0854 [Caldimonas brevitalea]
MRCVFECIVGLRFSAQGPVSGRRYQFTGPGSRAEVDPRDVPYLAQMRVLRRV